MGEEPPTGLVPLLPCLIDSEAGGIGFGFAGHPILLFCVEHLISRRNVVRQQSLTARTFGSKSRHRAIMERP